MLSEIVIQEMLDGEEKTVSKLVEKVFDEFVAPDYAPEGAVEFKRYIGPEALINRMRDDQSFILTAKDAGKIVGVIAIRGGPHILLLFVHKDHHRLGIARALFSAAKERSLEKSPDLERITVNSSPFAISVYESLGFEATQPELVINGIRHTPMACDITGEEGVT
ncbi:MAG: GNAT family N-acetyltransferase [Actinomycetota bacterium]|nr:GNAT family N-acetyltransferase [Actinomycetota bacterium]